MQVQPMQVQSEQFIQVQPLQVPQPMSRQPHLLLCQQVSGQVDLMEGCIYLSILHHTKCQSLQAKSGQDARILHYAGSR